MDLGRDSRDVAAELSAREPIFHRTAHGTTRADWDAMTSTDYWEIGASGKVYSRADVLAELDRRYADATYDPMRGLSVKDFAVRHVEGDTWLATYLLEQDRRLTWRSSLWRRVGRRWVLLYHQGTVVA